MRTQQAKREKKTKSLFFVFLDLAYQKEGGGEGGQLNIY